MLARDRAAEVTINRFFAWVATHSGSYGLGTTGPAVRARYAAEQAPQAGGPCRRAEWQDVFLRAPTTRGTGRASRPRSGPGSRASAGR